MVKSTCQVCFGGQGERSDVSLWAQWRIAPRAEARRKWRVLRSAYTQVTERVDSIHTAAEISTLKSIFVALTYTCGTYSKKEVTWVGSYLRCEPALGLVGLCRRAGGRGD